MNKEQEIQNLEDNDDIEEKSIEEYKQENEIDVVEELNKKNKTLQDTKFGIFTTDWPINHILELFESNDFVVPKYQRDLVWTKTQKSKFIETILLDFPVPSIFIASYESEKYYIIDGLQRLKTIEWFAKQDEDNKINTNIEQWNKKSIKTLNEEEKKTFRRKRIPTTILDMESMNISSEKKAILLSDIFTRINTSGTKLSKQDIRQAIYFGDFMDFLNKSADENGLTEVMSTKKYDNLDKHERDKIVRIASEMILRIIHVYYYYKIENYFTKPLTHDNLNYFCGELNKIYKEEKTQLKINKKELENIFENIKNFLNNFFSRDENFFKNWNVKKNKFDRYNKLYIESFIVSFLVNKNINFEQDKLKEFKIKFSKDDVQNQEWTNRTSDYTKIKKRIETVLHFFGN